MKSILIGEEIPDPLPKPTYANINEIPIPLRHDFIKMHRDRGLAVKHIAFYFEIPEEWVRLFVECPPGSTEH